MLPKFPQEILDSLNSRAIAYLVDARPRMHLLGYNMPRVTTL